MQWDEDQSPWLQQQQQDQATVTPSPLTNGCFNPFPDSWMKFKLIILPTCLIHYFFFLSYPETGLLINWHVTHVSCNLVNFPFKMKVYCPLKEEVYNVITWSRLFNWVSLILKRKAEATELIRRSARSKCSNCNRGDSSVGSRQQFHQFSLQQLNSDHQPFLLKNLSSSFRISLAMLGSR